MKVTADTNVLLRIVLRDDPDQAVAAEAVLTRATLIAIPIPVLCEFAWVLMRSYRQTADDVASAIRAVCKLEGVVTDRQAAEAGVSALLAGGDFADGAIARQGEALGGTVFATFDKAAIVSLEQTGIAAADPTELAHQQGQG